MRKIDADALLGKLALEMDVHEFEIVEEIVEHFPTIEEPILCKDCKWWTNHANFIQGRCKLMGMYPTGAWFCANAERKKGADNES